MSTLDDETAAVVEAHGADAAPASAEAVLARMRRGGEVPHLLGGFGPLVLAVLLALLVIVLVPSNAPEQIVERPVQTTSASDDSGAAPVSPPSGITTEATAGDGG